MSINLLCSLTLYKKVIFWLRVATDKRKGRKRKAPTRQQLKPISGGDKRLLYFGFIADLSYNVIDRRLRFPKTIIATRQNGSVSFVSCDIWRPTVYRMDEEWATQLGGIPAGGESLSTSVMTCGDAIHINTGQKQMKDRFWFFQFLFLLFSNLSCCMHATPALSTFNFCFRWSTVPTKKGEGILFMCWIIKMILISSDAAPLILLYSAIN